MTTELDRPALKPCPFCGADPTIIQIGNDYTKKRSVIIKCKQCRIHRKDSALINSMDWLINVAVEQWNKRVM